MALVWRADLWAIGGLVAACGGGDEQGLFGKGVGGAESGGASSGGSGGVTGSGGAATGGVTGGGSGGAPSGGTAGDAGTLDGSSGSGGAGGSGGGAVGGKGGTGGVSSGGSGGASGVGTGPCGGAQCAFSAGDACCKADNTPLYCSNEALANPCKCSGILCDTLELKCDGPEDCSSAKTCCAERGLTSSSWDVVECRETCKSDPIVGSTRREVCHPGGKPCPAGAQCLQDPGLPTGYHTCQ